jgi:hypothetical protein
VVHACCIRGLERFVELASHALSLEDRSFTTIRLVFDFSGDLAYIAFYVNARVGFQTIVGAYVTPTIKLRAFPHARCPIFFNVPTVIGGNDDDLSFIEIHPTPNAKLQLFATGQGT